MTNSYYKQLKHKEQECEELQKITQKLESCPIQVEFFMNKPVAYWLELEKWAKLNNIEKTIETLCKYKQEQSDYVLSSAFSLFLGTINKAKE